jgi:ABC-type glycerol-3-phosphate transport system substrate-binding protein
MNRVLRIAYCGFLILLAGCSSLQSINVDWINRILYTPTPVPIQTSTPIPQPIQTSQASTGQPPPISQPQILRIWLPEQFNPNANNPAATLLKQRLAEFEAEHPGLQLDIRIKAETGDADLLNSLSVTNMAAQKALPDLVALPRPALEVAAQKGLVHSLDDFSPELQKADWYPYARDLAKVDGTVYGIPFAGDAEVIIYRPDLVWIKTWDDILLSESHLIFAGADPQAKVGLTLYVSAGGNLLDAQGRPTLDQEVLTQVLELFAKGKAATLFPAAATNISSDQQALQEYRTRRADMAIVRFSDYRAEQDGLVQALMGLKADTHLTFSSGWVWSLAGQNSDNQALALELAQFLMDDNFLLRWLPETGFLPTRRPATNRDASSPIPAVIEAMQPGPSSDTVAALGPLMQEAVTRVLNGEQPEAVARSVVEKLK